MSFAARLTDMQVCPMVTAGTPSVPHVGGTIDGPGVSTVLIGGLTASVVGDSCTCVGATSTVATGSTTVMIGGIAAARVGDSTDHGGSISTGCSSVLIGG
ncbi:PAAR domain-containing protein [Vibrio sp. WXL103]|uniref:PAAR domain-containing protein n=1 Tax=Vibrio sp. WXL103 TaxID=3450710 RepID=UPI003EC8D9D4